MKVLAVASEAYPLIKTGGLADVVGALPAALGAHDVEVRTLLPGYRAVLAKTARARTLHTFPDLFGGPARVRATTAGGLPVLVLEAPHLFDRPGGPYSDAAGRDWPDNPIRFAALAAAAAAIARGLLPWRPDLVHAHDWQAGLVPAYLRWPGSPVPSVFTVHNLAFQGWAPPNLLATLGLPPESFTIDGVEFFGGIGFLKAGLRLADAITTVSPTYADEITRPEHGQALDGLLRARSADLHGILNGIDTAVWDPAHDPLLQHRYTGAHARRRGRNKAALQAEMGLAPDPSAPLFGVVSRLTSQKGIDLILEALPVIQGLGGQLAVVGSGEAAIEAALAGAAADTPGRVGLRVGYDERLAHLLQAGCDALLVPSRFEPCGLTQLCALRYGAIPVVARVGGLADTVVDANPAALAAGVATGFQFLPVNADGLIGAIRRVVAAHGAPATWAQLMRNAMRADVGWDTSARLYAELFRTMAWNSRAKCV